MSHISRQDPSAHHRHQASIFIYRTRRVPSSKTFELDDYSKWHKNRLLRFGAARFGPLDARASHVTGVPDYERQSEDGVF